MPADVQRPDADAPAGRIDLGPGVFVSRSDVRFATARAGGPGGQNVNKLNTKVELWVPMSAIQGLSDAARGRLRQFAGKRLTSADELHVSASDARSQEANRRAAVVRLAELVARAAIEPRRRRKTRPTRASKQRRIEAKKHRSALKSDRRGGARGED